MLLLRRIRSSRFTRHASRVIGCFAIVFLCLPVIVRAQGSGYGVSVGASAVNSDFRTSKIELEASDRPGIYVIKFQLQNSGHLTAEDTKISLVLSEGWEYQDTEGDYVVILSQPRSYGHSLEWTLPKISSGGSYEMSSTIVLPEGVEPSPLFAAITSDHSTPVYAEIVVGTASSTTFWDSYVRSAWLRITYAFQEWVFRASRLLSWRK